MTDESSSTVLEGFLCPICLQDLGSFHQLHRHFEAAHSATEKQLLGQLKGLFGNVKKAFHGAAPANALNPFESDNNDADNVNTPARNQLLTTTQPAGCSIDHSENFKALRSKRLNQFIVQSNSLIIRLQKLVNLAPVDDPRMPFEMGLVPWIDDSQVSLCPGCGRKFLPAIRKKHHCRLCGAIMCDECSVNLDVESARNVIRDIFRDTATPTGAPLPYSSSNHSRASFTTPRRAANHLPIPEASSTTAVRHSISPSDSYVSSSSSSLPSLDRGLASQQEGYTSDMTVTSRESNSINGSENNNNHRSRSPSIVSTTNSSQTAAAVAATGGSGSSLNSMLRNAVRLPRISSLSSSTMSPLATATDEAAASGRFSRLASFSSIPSSTTLKDDIKAVVTRFAEDGLVFVKMCQPCWMLVERRARAKHSSPRALDAVLLEKYETLRNDLDAVETLFSKYETMTAALRAADDTIDYDEVVKVRTRLCGMFELLDAASKALVSSDAAQQQQQVNSTSDAAGAPQLRSCVLRRKIRQHCVEFMQRRCLAMSPLPTQEELAAVKKEREDEQKARWLRIQQRQQEESEQQLRKLQNKKLSSSPKRPKATTKSSAAPVATAAPTGFLPEPMNPFEINEYDDPVLQQITQIKEFLQQARSAERVDEVRILEANLSELNDIYEQKLASSASSLNSR